MVCTCVYLFFKRDGHACCIVCDISSLMNTNLSSHQHAQHATNKSFWMGSNRRWPNLPAETTTSVRVEDGTVFFHRNPRMLGHSEGSPLKGVNSYYMLLPFWHQTRVWELPSAIGIWGKSSVNRIGDFPFPYLPTGGWPLSLPSILGALNPYSGARRN